MSGRTLFICILAIAALGCSDNGPISPRVGAKLAATPISSPLLASTSPLIEAVSLADSNLELDLGESDMYRSEKFTDIRIIGAVSNTYSSDTIRIYDYSGGSWRDVNSGYWTILVCAGFCRGEVQRLSSQIEGVALGDLLSPEGRLHIHASRIEQLRGQLVDYLGDYHFVTLQTFGVPTELSMSYSNGGLYLFQNFGTVDSLYAVGADGRRRWSAGFQGALASMAGFDGQDYWVYSKGLGAAHVLQVDTLGNVLDSLLAPDLDARAVTFADGRLWVVGSLGIFKSSPETDKIEDTIVFTQTSNLHLGGTVSLTADEDGLIVAVDGTGSIVRYTFEGQFRDSIVTHASQPQAIAWDGESLWIAHHGPDSAATRAVLLSRFTLN